MALDEYLVEEIRIDHHDGHLSRREAMRLLGLLGLTATAARLWLDNASADAATTKKKAKTTKAKPKPKATTKTTAKAPAPTTTAPTTTASQSVESAPAPTAQGAVPTSAISFAGPAGELKASFAAAAKPKGAVLIIHENRGLTQHFKDLPGRFARDGYSALALDLASRAGGTDAVASQMPAPLAQAKPEDLVADMKAGLDELSKRTPGAKLAIIGFCFGGGMVWNLLNAGEPRLAAATPFYGTGPADADFTKSPNAAVLAVYAELDARVNANRPAMTEALERSKLKHKIVSAPGVDHAFFNDTGARYNPAQAAAIYAAVLAWYGEHLA